MAILQDFRFNKSRYERPTESWHCGRGQQGKPCQLGPDLRGQCRATFECTPQRRADRWFCTREEKCEAGPLPDGTCACAIPKCLPVRSTRAKRSLTIQWAVLLTLGLLLFGLSNANQYRFISAGPLSPAHGPSTKNCNDCHTTEHGNLATWVWQAFQPVELTKENVKCLNCHDFGEYPLAAHAQPPQVLAKLTAQAATGHLPQTLTRKVFGHPMQDREKFACTTCHHEHRGRQGPVTVMKPHRCQACHQGQFDRFSNGHPEFSGFPYTRRTRLIFDHASHFGKHFASDKAQGRQPETCNNCHHPDSAGEQMLVNGFDAICSECHLEQIEGNTRAGAKGLAVLTVPGLDLDSLQAAGLSTGNWPAYADQSITPFMRLLLNDSFEMEKAFILLENVDLLDLSSAEPEQLEAAVTLAWGIKRLFHELRLQGQMGLKARLERIFGSTLSHSQLSGLSGLLPAEVVSTAQHEWFPNIEQEMAQYLSGELPPVMPPETPPTTVETAQTVAPAADDELILDSSDDDILGAEDELILSDDANDELILSTDSDDILSSDDDILADTDLTDELTLEETDTPPAAKPVVKMSEEDWVMGGGWYRQYFTLYYRPTGHADTFLFHWLNLTAHYADEPMTERLFNNISQPKGVGVCTKCHSVDESEYGLEVNWFAKWPMPHQQRFNRFSHTAHFSLLDPKGCLTCHELNVDANYETAFEHRNPNDFSSNFHAIEKSRCLECHKPGVAGDDCLTCHNYHVGQIVSKIPETKITME